MALAVAWMVSGAFLILRLVWWLGKAILAARRRRRQALHRPPPLAYLPRWAPVADRRHELVIEAVRWCLWSMFITGIDPDAVVRAIRQTHADDWQTTARVLAEVDWISTATRKPDFAVWCMTVGDIARGRNQAVTR